MKKHMSIKRQLILIWRYIFGFNLKKIFEKAYKKGKVKSYYLTPERKQMLLRKKE